MMVKSSICLGFGEKGRGEDRENLGSQFAFKIKAT